jgi:Conserved hypothetical ATP binding protein
VFGWARCSQWSYWCVAYGCCTRYLLQNMDWLEEELGGYEDDYLIIDCPGLFPSILDDENNV